ncbi:MAG: hypothetical protein O2967_13755 [Proteobacteria bacterium]|nr:hypothetical protein [Pseudomonadota bacterium]
MIGSTKMLLGSLALAALMASTAASAHPTGNTGGTMMGQGGMGQSGMVQSGMGQGGMGQGGMGQGGMGQCGMESGASKGMMHGDGNMHHGQGGAEMPKHGNQDQMGGHHMEMHQGNRHHGGHGASAMMAPGHKGSGHHGRGGMRVTPVQHLTVDDVSHFFGHRLERRGNKRLKLGEVTQKDEDTITAQIVTVDGSLVQIFEVDRHSGVAKRAN